ncbi:unnamed protein product, partial [Oikopleura dioica]
MAKAAEDALKQYMEAGVMDDNHRKYLERILADAKHAKLQNKTAAKESVKNLEKLVDDGSKQKLKIKEKREPSPISYEKPPKSSKMDDDKWPTNRLNSRVVESF